MHLDRAQRDEERLRDLSVREALGGHRGDPALARRQRGGPRLGDAAGARSGCDQLFVGVLGEQGGSASLRELERPMLAHEQEDERRTGERDPRERQQSRRTRRRANGRSSPSPITTAPAKLSAKSGPIAGTTS
jgi:hypothetical protein